MNKITDNMYLEVGLETTDIGGTNATGKSIDMQKYEIAAFCTEIGTWNVADEPTCQIKQSKTANMAGAIVIPGHSALLHTDAADGLRYAQNIKASELTLEYRYVALYVACVGNTGADELTVSQCAGIGRMKYANLGAYDTVDAAS